jgi:hypothetical protein
MYRYCIFIEMPSEQCTDIVFFIEVPSEQCTDIVFFIEVPSEQITILYIPSLILNLVFVRYLHSVHKSVQNREAVSTHLLEHLIPETTPRISTKLRISISRI